jgi:hypothetical protein
LHRTVAGIRHDHRDGGAARVEFVFAIVDEKFAGNHLGLPYVISVIRESDGER